MPKKKCESVPEIVKNQVSLFKRASDHVISIIYRVPNNFHQKLIEPSAREVEGQQF